MRAKNKGGLDVPWFYVRSLLARRWHCFPWEVDELPVDEVQLEVHIMNEEAEKNDGA